jgi:hypothetical protein
MTRVLAVIGLCAAPSIAGAQFQMERQLDPARTLAPTTAAGCAPATTARDTTACEIRHAASPLALSSLPGRQNPPAQSASFWSVLASATVPGTGQAMLGVQRFVPYMAFEAYAWTQYFSHAGEYDQYRDSYVELSSRVARSKFTIIFPAGDFEYYERMQHFRESGRFEVVAGGVLDPEPDSTTFNGSVWLLARRTYWNDVDAAPDTSTREWKQAADFYLRRAYEQPYRWSWTGAPLEFDEFRRLIRRSNDSNRKAVQDLGVIIANHMLSAVDAYVTVRLRRRPTPEGGGSAWTLDGALPLATVSKLFAR